MWRSALILLGALLLGLALGSAAGPALAAAHDPDSHVAWYVARAAGLSAYLLLFVDVCLGLLVRTRLGEALVTRWQTFDLHQFTALLALGFLALHLAALLADRFIGFSPAQLLLPFSSPYRPLWTGLGVVALYLLLLVVASSYLRPMLGQRAWRTLHYLAFAAFGLALVHGLFAGTDSDQAWARALYGSTGLGTAGLIVWRFRGAGRASSSQRASGLPARST